MIDRKKDSPMDDGPPGAQGENAEPKGGEEIDLTEEDEAALDAAWERIAAEERGRRRADGAARGRGRTTPAAARGRPGGGRKTRDLLVGAMTADRGVVLTPDGLVVRDRSGEETPVEGMGRPGEPDFEQKVQRHLEAMRVKWGMRPIHGGPRAIALGYLPDLKITGGENDEPEEYQVTYDATHLIEETADVLAHFEDRPGDEGTPSEPTAQTV